jgi:glycosyltransferase involved in cell wall biosynthesis
MPIGTQPRVLMLYLEPAPYVTGLVGEVRKAWSGAVDVVFVYGALTQRWHDVPASPGERVLPGGVWRALAAIVRSLARGRYDLVHLAGWGHPVLLVTLLLAALFRIPVTAETDTPLEHDGAWKRLIKRRTHGLLFRLPTMFLAAGTRQAAYLRHYGVGEERTRVAQMTVDVSRMVAYAKARSAAAKDATLRRHRLPPQTTKFLYVGRLEIYKGVLDLLESCRHLASCRPISLLIVGDGSLRRRVECFARADARIHCIGRLEGEDLWDVYSISDVLVLPSHSDSWGLVVNEAMAFGLPVIVTHRVGCIDDLVIADETGLVVRSNAPPALADAMERFTDEGTRRRMGAVARARISGWTLQNSASITISAWRDVLE